MNKETNNTSKGASAKRYDLIGTEEVAAILGYKTAASFRTMYHRARPFPAYRIANNRVMFERSDVMNYIESVRVEAVDMFLQPEN